MRIVNERMVPDYHPQIIVNARRFLDRVPVTGAAEARELSKCADLLEAIISGLYTVTDGENTIGTGDRSGRAESVGDNVGSRRPRSSRVSPPKTNSGLDAVP